jgi:hypothetical protein
MMKFFKKGSELYGHTRAILDSKKEQIDSLDKQRIHAMGFLESRYGSYVPDEFAEKGESPYLGDKGKTLQYLFLVNPLVKVEQQFVGFNPSNPERDSSIDLMSNNFIALADSEGHVQKYFGGLIPRSTRRLVEYVGLNRWSRTEKTFFASDKVIPVYQDNAHFEAIMQAIQKE